MMKTKIPLLSALFAAVFPALPAHAILEENCVTVNGRITYQLPTFFDATARIPSSLHGEVGSLRFNSKDLLNYIANDLFLSLPRGAKFLHVNYGMSAGSTEEKGAEKAVVAGMWIVDKEGFQIANVSDYFNLNFKLEGLVFEGWRDEFGENTKNRFPFRICLDFPIFDSSSIRERGNGSWYGTWVFLKGKCVAKTDCRASLRNDVFRAVHTGKGDGYVTGFVNTGWFDTIEPEGFKSEGGNAVGYVWLRFDGRRTDFFD